MTACRVKTEVMGTGVQLAETKDGVVVPVHAQPHAKQNAIAGTLAGSLKVSVTAVPEKGKANDAIIRLLAASLGLRRGQLTLVSGATSNRKRILVSTITLNELRQRIERIVGPNANG